MFERRFVIKFKLVEKRKPWETCRSMCDVYREARFGQKMFTYELNMGLPLRTWVEKLVHWVETHWVSGKEKVTGAGVSNKSQY